MISPLQIDIHGEKYHTFLNCWLPKTVPNIFFGEFSKIKNHWICSEVPLKNL